MCYLYITAALLAALLLAACGQNTEEKWQEQELLDPLAELAGDYIGQGDEDKALEILTYALETFGQEIA